MGSKGKKILIVLGIIAALAVVLFMVTSANEKETDIDVNESEILVQIPIDEIHSVSIIQNNNEDVEFIIENGVWVLKENKKNLILNQDEVMFLCYSVANLSSITRVEDDAAEDLSPYGLETPSTVVIQKKDGSKQSIYCGDKLPTRDSYYLMLEGDSTIYEVYSGYGEILKREFSDYLNKDVFVPIDISSLHNLTISEDDNTYTVEYTDKDENSPILQFTNFKMYNYFVQPRDVDETKLNGMINDINAFAQFEYIVLEDNFKLSDYGLDYPEIIIEINDLKIYIGNTFDDNKVYYSIEGDENIYAISQEAVENIILTEPYDLILRFILLVKIDAVESVTINGYSQKYVLSIEREGSSVDYYINSKPIEEEKFKEIYQYISGLIADGEIHESVQNEIEDVTIEYKYDSGHPNNIVSFTDYNDNFYAAYADDICDFVVSKDEIEKIFKILGEFDDAN